MQEVADWLAKLNLGQYAQRFADNDIDVSVLHYLTDTDLEKIGVSLGHRRNFWQLSPSYPAHLCEKMRPLTPWSRNPKKLRSVARSP